MPQPLPTRHTPWEHSAQAKLIEMLPPDCAWLASHIRRRSEVGLETYNSYLGVGNPGRDGDQDLRDELLDGAVYAHERWLATGRHRYAQIRDLCLRGLVMLGE
jgi:hypothetical protein